MPFCCQKKQIKKNPGTEFNEFEPGHWTANPWSYIYKGVDKSGMTDLRG